MVYNAAAYYGRNGRVYQYPKFAWNIHGFTPLFSIQFQSVIPAILIYLFTILRVLSKEEHGKNLSFNNHCHTHTATDAHGNQTGIVTLSFHLVNSGDHLASTRAPDGMAQRNSRT